MLDQAKTPWPMHFICISVLLSSSFSGTLEQFAHRMKGALMKWVYAVGKMGLDLMNSTGKTQRQFPPKKCHSFLALCVRPVEEESFSSLLCSESVECTIQPSALHHTKDAVFKQPKGNYLSATSRSYDYHKATSTPLSLMLLFLQQIKLSQHIFSYEFDYLKHYMVQLSSTGFTLLLALRSVCSVV